MLWPTSASTERIDGVEYRNVWRRDELTVQTDAIALGERLVERFPSTFWRRHLCAVAYENGRLLAITHAEFNYAQRLKANMAYLRFFSLPEERARTEAPLILKSHEIMRQHALDHPEEKVGGTVQVIMAKGTLQSPIAPGFMVLVGYTPRDQPVLLRWFEHFRL